PRVVAAAHGCRRPGAGLRDGPGGDHRPGTDRFPAGAAERLPLRLRPAVHGVLHAPARGRHERLQPQRRGPGQPVARPGHLDDPGGRGRRPAGTRRRRQPAAPAGMARPAVLLHHRLGRGQRHRRPGPGVLALTGLDGVRIRHGRESMPSVVSPANIAAALTELWSPRVVGELDDAYIKVAKVHGTLAWHSHENEDEMFLVLKGRLRIEMEATTVELGEGDMYVVPKGVRHNPVADDECLIMLIERKSTLHTGDVRTEKTRSLDEQLRPVG